MTRKNEQERFMSYITERQTHESRMAVADFFSEITIKKAKDDRIEKCN